MIERVCAIGVSALLLAACSGHIAEGAAGDDPAGATGARPGAGAPPGPGANGEPAPGGVAGRDAMDGDDGDDPAQASCDGLGDVGAPLPLRRLNATQVERSVADVLGVQAALAVTDEKLFTYRSNVSAALDATSARGYLDFAEATVAGVDLTRCASEDCLGWLLDEIGPGLFRRPIEAEQRARYEALYAQGAAEGARWVLEAMLQSPSFLYLDEVEDDDGYLDDYSIAARLALVLWGSNPDAALRERAGDGGLSSADDVRAEAQRMLEDPRSEDGLRDFVDQWLELQRLADADARPDLAALGEDTVNALRDEPVQLFHALLEEGGGLAELLTTTETVRLDSLGSTYGADVVSMTSTRYALDPARRAGILTLPGVMAALSHAQATSPTLRGYAVLASFLCSPPPPPPAGVNPTLPEVGPDATARERLEAHFSDDSCGSCHRGMDGIGFAFEGFDWLGRSRDEDESGNPIDAASMFALGGRQVSVDGAVELAALMAESDAVAECVARQWARYATGIPENSDAACLMQQLGQDIVQDGGLRAMMLSYVSSDWFRRGHGGDP
jgi:hypothetical protein